MSRLPLRHIFTRPGTPYVVPPSTRGDDLNFVRYDPAKPCPCGAADAAQILTFGHMHRDQIEAEQRDPAAAAIIVVSDRASLDRHHLNVRTGDIEDCTAPRIVPVPAPDLSALLEAAIAAELARTDRYFVADALENISPAEQAQWLEYRKELRAGNAALKQGREVSAVLADLPKDLKSVDHFAAFSRIQGNI
jgi:hypothetical protein